MGGEASSVLFASLFPLHPFRQFLSSVYGIFVPEKRHRRPQVLSKERPHLVHVLPFISIFSLRVATHGARSQEHVHVFADDFLEILMKHPREHRSRRSGGDLDGSILEEGLAALSSPSSCDAA